MTTSTRPLFFFGAMSPYSWFVAERIDAMVPDAEWRPVFAGGLFKDAGRSSWGLDDRRPAGLADCEARARQHGLGPMIWPDPWPTLDLLIARGMLHAERHGLLRPFALEAMRMAFREGVDLGELVAVEAAGERVGLDPAGLARAVQGDELKAALRDVNAQARALGVYGVPTVVAGGERFWGDDRLEEAATATRRIDE